MKPLCETWNDLKTELTWLLKPYPEPPYDDDWNCENCWYKNEFQVNENVDYDLLLEHAQQQRNEIKEGTDRVEQRAEWLFGVAMLLFGFSSYLASTPTSFLLTCPSGLALVICAYACYRTRHRGAALLPFNTRDALSIEESGDSFHPVLVANMHVANESLRRVNHWKGRQLNLAGWCLMVAVMMMGLPLANRAMSHPKPPQSTKHQDAEAHFEPHVSVHSGHPLEVRISGEGSARSSVVIRHSLNSILSEKEHDENIENTSSAR